MGVTICILLIILAAIGFGAWLQSNRDEHMGISHSCAHYDLQTGAFTWNSPAP